MKLYVWVFVRSSNIASLNIYYISNIHRLGIRHDTRHTEIAKAKM